MPAAPDLCASGLRGVLFDLDGVVTDTARLHGRAWQELFDGFLAKQDGAAAPFRLPQDYVRHVDGKPRYEGVHAFLRSRGIELPWGDPADPAEARTICGLGNRKNRLFHRALAEQGVAVFAGSVALIEALRTRGIKTACVSSSKNAVAVLERAGLLASFDLVLDGRELAELGLPGKPCPDMFTAAAARLGVVPAAAAVIEDAVAGVAAGRAGGFKLVIGVDRGAGRTALAEAGADVVVGDLAELPLPPAAGEER
jgi:beta-phosphoglucomutase family hydrolase